MSEIAWLPFAPQSLTKKTSRKAILDYATKLVGNGHLTEADQNTQRQLLRNEIDRAIRILGERDRSLTLAAILVLTDLVRHGWRLEIKEGVILVLRPELRRDANPTEEKQRIRKQLHVSRDYQLRTPATRSFIHSMERRRLYKGEFLSIFSLMRDGSDLAKRLQSISEQHVCDNNTDALRKIIDPYLQFAEAGETCSFTGFQLLDIWRYFRHTWANPYSSVPGRWMPILVRDAAVKHHPVIGIAALTSPVVQLNVRDNWIGWSPDTFVARQRSNPTLQIARWLQRSIDGSITEIYKTDFFEAGLITPSEIKKPTPKSIEALEKLARAEREKHYRFMNADEYKSARTGATGKTDWVVQARSPLYKSKRAEFLARFLKYRLILNNHFDNKPSAAEFEKLLKKSVGAEIVRGALQKI